MRKIIGFIFAVIAISVGFSACKSETYADKLKKETEAINRFIDENGISVINKYPANGVFETNQYYKDPDTGIYFHVINAGTSDKPIKGKTTVTLRFENIINMLTKDTVGYSNMTPGMDLLPMEFQYGRASTYVCSSTSASYSNKLYQMYMFLSPACVLPLDFGLGYGAEVSLIVPFLNGSSMQQANYTPFRFGRLRYTFINDDSGN